MRNYPLAATATLAAALSSGCQTHPTASQPSHPTDVERVALPEVTWAFERHSFGAYCYNTIGCKVLYDEHYQGIDYGDNQVTPPPRLDAQARWDAHYGVGYNFPQPAVVTWRSLDGAAHEAMVDIGEIFKEERVLHDVPTHKLSALAAKGGGSPAIILVVDDRTISIYMKTFVSLKERQVPSNAYSDALYEPVLAYRRTY